MNGSPGASRTPPSKDESEPQADSRQPGTGGRLHYWNQRNFEGLAQLADALRRDARLNDLARYCELRHEGRRPEAFAALESFLASALASPTDVQRELALIVLGAHDRITEAHQFLSHPLKARLLVPVLRAWCEAEPDHAVPLSELGRLQRDAGLLTRALERDPTDDDARRCLISLLLASVDFATHHLVEGLLIGTLEEAQETLSLAAGHVAASGRPEAFADLSAQVAAFAELLGDWNRYRQHPIGTFAEWCQERGRSHRWSHSVRYRR